MRAELDSVLGLNSANRILHCVQLWFPLNYMDTHKSWHNLVSRSSRRDLLFLLLRVASRAIWQLSNVDTLAAGGSVCYCQSWLAHGSCVHSFDIFQMFISVIAIPNSKPKIYSLLLVW